MKDDMIYLEHIIDCIDRINNYAENVMFLKFSDIFHQMT